MLNVNKHMSLMERKKLQWAQERAEMEGLGNPWGLPAPAFNIKYSNNRSRYASTLEIRSTCPQTTQQDLLPRRQRSPSLPPILKMQEGIDNPDVEIIKRPEMKYSNGDFERTHNNLKYRYEDGEGETSGYASDSAPHSSPEIWKSKQLMNATSDGRQNQSFPAWQYNERGSVSRGRQRNLGREEESRPKWGDRGVAAGRLWEPQDAEARLPQMLVKGTPSWVERGLSMIDNGGPQILVIDQAGNHSSTMDSYNSKSASENNLDRCTTHLLGQNVHIEPNIKAERECKRLKALELQAAIMQQLEEREKRKKQEKERRIKEEQDEEERFKRQLDLERQRLEEERRISEEKQQREQKRADALRQALEKAEQQAKLDKENKKFKKLRDNFDAMSMASEMDSHHCRKQSISQQSNPYNESKLIQNIYIEQAFSPRRKVLTEQDSISQVAPSLSSETNIIMSNPQSARYSHQIDTFSNEQPIDLNKRHENQRQHSESVCTSYQNNPQVNVSDAPVSLVQVPLAHDVLTPVHFAHGSSVQMAFLMPQHMNPIYPCLHQPVNMQAIFPSDAAFTHHRNYQMQSQAEADECRPNRENKILTPSKYRSPNYKDVCTQTDIEYKKLAQPVQTVETNSTNEEEQFKNKSASILDQNYEQTTSEEKLNSLTFKKDKRPEEKYKEMESRPKWGVNKPPTQYKKQSEKDIFYPQKRKLRQRKRVQEKNYTSHSSDENRSPSPPREFPKNFPKLDRNRVSLTENYWRKKSMKNDRDMNIENVTVETTQISPLECDQSGIVRISDNFTNKKKVYSDTKNTFKRGITLSQKFMNDKYGKPKLWGNDLSTEDKVSQRRDVKEEQNIKFKEKSDHRKQFLDSVNKTKKEQSAYYCERESNQPIILDQLRSLRDSLNKQQQMWGKYDQNNRSPSPKNDVDMEME